MASRKPTHTHSPAARRFWQESFMVAKACALAKLGTRAPQGSAQLAAEHADADLAEYRRRFGAPARRTIAPKIMGQS
jgi:hypothetical protein